MNEWMDKFPSFLHHFKHRKTARQPLSKAGTYPWSQNKPGAAKPAGALLGAQCTTPGCHLLPTKERL